MMVSEVIIDGDVLTEKEVRVLQAAVCVVVSLHQSTEMTETRTLLETVNRLLSGNGRQA